MRKTHKCSGNNEITNEKTMKQSYSAKGEKIMKEEVVTRR
jgi:hypothetical protein